MVSWQCNEADRNLLPEWSDIKIAHREILRSADNSILLTNRYSAMLLRSTQGFYLPQQDDVDMTYHNLECDEHCNNV